ncbi:MAG: M18 family aminopeptidase [Pseudomonadota bacterium]
MAPLSNQELCHFLQAAPTPFHAVAAMAARLQEAGFQSLDESGPWELAPAGRYFVTRNQSSLIAFQLADEASIASGWRMVGAHTDSPCLKVKPLPEVVRQGYFQLGVEVYGGVLLNPWFDRDLSLAGRVHYVDSKQQLQHALVDFRKAIAVIPSLAIHLDRDQNQKRSINAQNDLLPLLLQAADKDVPNFRELLAVQLRHEQPQLDVQEVLDYEISLYDTNPAALVGLQEEFIASARLDNLLSCFVGLHSLLQSTGSANRLLVCTDHEEVGSATAAGAAGPFLESVLRRINEKLLDGTNEGFHRQLSLSTLASVDNAHGIHPNFADKHDSKHGPLLNGGPVLKFNANQRYATNSQSSAQFRQLCQQANVPLQSFVVRSDMGCGSTIGPLVATELGINTVDIGVPTFAMHSIRELAGSRDTQYLAQALTQFLS